MKDDHKPTVSQDSHYRYTKKDSFKTSNFVPPATMVRHPNVNSPHSHRQHANQDPIIPYEVKNLALADSASLGKLVSLSQHDQHFKDKNCAYDNFLELPSITSCLLPLLPPQQHTPLFQQEGVPNDYDLIFSTTTFDCTFQRLDLCMEKSERSRSALRKFNKRQQRESLVKKIHHHGKNIPKKISEEDSTMISSFLHENQDPLPFKSGQNCSIGYNTTNVAAFAAHGHPLMVLEEEFGTALESIRTRKASVDNECLKSKVSPIESCSSRRSSIDRLGKLSCTGRNIDDVLHNDCAALSMDPAHISSDDSTCLNYSPPIRATLPHTTDIDLVLNPPADHEGLYDSLLVLQPDDEPIPITIVDRDVSDGHHDALCRDRRRTRTGGSNGTSDELRDSDHDADAEHHRARRRKRRRRLPKLPRRFLKLL